MLLPAVDLAPGAELTNAIRVVDDQRTRLGNLGSGQTDARLNAYQDWAVNASGALRYVLAYDDVRAMIETSSYEQLLSRGGSGPNPALVNGLINSELEDRKRYFDRVLQDLRRTQTEVEALPSGAGVTVLVPDTNVYLHHPSSFPNVDWPAAVPTRENVRVLAPMVVLRELDKNKRAPGSKTVGAAGSEPVRDRARRSAREISTMFTSHGDTPRLAGSADTTFGLLLDPVGHVPISDPDTEFIDRVASLKAFSDRKIAIVTSDNGMRSAAMVAGIGVVDVKDAGEAEA